MARVGLAKRSGHLPKKAFSLCEHIRGLPCIHIALMYIYLYSATVRVCACVCVRACMHVCVCVFKHYQLACKYLRLTSQVQMSVCSMQCCAYSLTVIILNGDCGSVLWACHHTNDHQSTGNHYVTKKDFFIFTNCISHNGNL